MVSDQIRTKSGEPYRPLADRRLLLVEDEALVAMELEELISHLGGEAVGPFSRVADALDALRRVRVNGAVLDVRLNGDTTFQIADILLQAANPILFVTGAIGSIPERYCHVPRLQKPFEYENFARLAILVFGND